MNRFLAILSGGIIAIAVMMNGKLSAAYGSTFSTMFIHLSGCVVALALILVLRCRPKSTGHSISPRLWMGGLIGVFTVYANIFTFGALGVSVTIALGLVGQCALSLAIDTFGWFGLPRQRISMRRLAGLGIILCGITVMLI